ncbi:signal peptidase II [Teredinibacter turnerae]|uniref:signal peptidase II n=1 Tax=Teredinibacter turnerae TaxID=2426 RepID=UPI0003654059|nr:signal peptidase II [Teredinibacter turnerae]
MLKPNVLAALKWYGVALLVILLDQITKNVASHMLVLHQLEPITSFFNFTLRHNFGAAFSMFHDAGGWQRWFLAILAAGVSVLLIFWIAKLPRQKWMEALALALVLGGALGNLYDRILLGYVVDFIVVHYKEHEWPAFNIADSAICIGAALLVWDSLFGTKVAKYGDAK